MTPLPLTARLRHLRARLARTRPSRLTLTLVAFAALLMPFGIPTLLVALPFYLRRHERLPAPPAPSSP